MLYENSYDITRPRTRTEKLSSDTRAAILKRYGSVANFGTESGVLTSISRDTLYRAMRGDPLNMQELMAVRTAWELATACYLTREEAEQVLAYGSELARKRQRTPISKEHVLQSLNELDKQCSFTG